ncbi:hypothetical protein [Labrys neptuniae]
MIKGLPNPTSGAADVAKLTTGIGTALAALWFPEAALAAPFLPFVIDKFIERPKQILIRALEKGDLSVLSDEQATEFVPMAYHFMEAAKRGEYAHTLEVLAGFIRGELREDTPDAASFARMSRRVEALSLGELRVLALVYQMAEPNDGDNEVTQWGLVEYCNGTGHPAVNDVFSALPELANRGFFVIGPVTPNTGLTAYIPATAFWELFKKAEDAIVTATRTP